MWGRATNYDSNSHPLLNLIHFNDQGQTYINNGGATIGEIHGGGGGGGGFSGGGAASGDGNGAGGMCLVLLFNSTPIICP